MEKINIVKNLSELQQLVNAYKRSNTITNNYIMLEDYKHYIDDGQLYYQVSGDNLLFLLHKDGFLQLYYYVNDLSENIKIETELPVVMEILYRGEKFYPTDIVGFWNRNGFAKHLGRDMMSASFNKISFPSELNNKVSVSFAKSEQEIRYSYELIRNTFDAYTGDILSIEQVRHFAENDELLLAKIDGDCCGILQLEIKNNVSWLGHIAVDTSFRKQGIANCLVNAWINRTANQPSPKYQLWVIQDNEPALNLYQNFGFVYINKSTISMLKK